MFGEIVSASRRGSRNGTVTCFVPIKNNLQAFARLAPTQLRSASLAWNALGVTKATWGVRQWRALSRYQESTNDIAISGLSSHQRDNDDHPDIDALLQENARLKELVVKLSGLVLKNVADRS